MLRRAPAPTLPCSASREGRPVALGTRTDDIVDLVAWGDRIYVLSYRQANARTTLSSYRRDGKQHEELGFYEGLGKPESFRVTTGGAYFTQRKALMWFSLDGGAPATVRDDFAHMATVDGAHAYGIRCRTAHMEDQLLRVGQGGGQVEPVATIARRTKTCKYGDLAVVGSTVFATDWEGRRLLAIDLPDGEVRILTTGHAFASTLFVHAEHVDFGTSEGLHRVSRQGGPARKLGRIGESMYDHVAFDGSDYWIFDGGRYEREYVWRLPGGGGEPERVYTFLDDDPLGSGAVGMSVDEQCFYYSQLSSDDSYAVLYAQKKPEPRGASPR